MCSPVSGSVMASSIDVCTLSAQAVREALAPHLGADPGDELVAVDRTDEEIVHADVEAAQHAGLVVGLGDHDDGGVAGAVERAQLAAQAQAVIADEVEADEDERRRSPRRP